MDLNFEPPDLTTHYDNSTRSITVWANKVLFQILDFSVNRPNPAQPFKIVEKFAEI